MLKTPKWKLQYKGGVYGKAYDTRDEVINAWQRMSQCCLELGWKKVWV